MSLNGPSFPLPPASQLCKESSLVQEHIRKKQQKQDFEQTIKAQLQRKHAQRRQKILVVANRLPTKPTRNSDGEWIFERCSGGLVSCLRSLQGRFEMVWIGWPGTEISDADKDMVSADAMKQNCYPVFLPQDLITEYYNGFANNVLWPLFHYIMPPFDKGVNECCTGFWEAYKKANELFTEAILQVYEDDDYVWVHDYHLMLVPKMLREAKPNCNIGWFLHTPFPAAEIYRTLPWRLELIESLLHANLVGFHVFDYMRHFINSCMQLTSLEISAHSVDATSIGGCIVTCVTVPIGISPTEFTDALGTTEVKQQIEKLREQYGERRVILGIDRLDYTKGIPHKILSFGRFLDQHPDMASSCVLVQLAVPSRHDVPEYQRLQRQVHELVGQISGRHSKLETGTPVIYLDASMSHSDLVALYRMADVALITSLRDGMNLVAYEFIACHKGRENPGVLILSEFTGAAQSLGAGALRVNPWNLQETANSIYEALEMNTEDRMELHKYAYEYITVHTAQKWAETFLQCLQEAGSDLILVTAEVPPLLPYEEFLTDWGESTRRLIIIDLLECLVPRKTGPGRNNNRNLPRTTLMPKELRECLSTIASSPNTTVVITTDKSRKALEDVCKNLPVILAPEGCCVYKRPGEDEWMHLVEDSDVEGREEWMEEVKGVFDYFKHRTPGSYIEKQDYQYRWYWDNAQTEFGQAQAKEVLIRLWAGPLNNSEAEVVVGDRSIAVRPHACSRSACLEKLLLSELGEEELQQLDFALCFAVVSHRDEDVFERVQKIFDDPSLLEEENTDTPADSPRSCESPARCSEPLLHTPPGPAPEVKPGELPPSYDWIPTAQRELSEQGPEVAEALTMLPPSSVDSEDRPTYCSSCYTMSLGMKKTKAKFALPQPYHVQNLIRAMAARLPQRQPQGDTAE